MEDFISQVATAITKDVKTMKADDEFRRYREWDSMAALEMITMLKQNYDIVIPRRKFDNLRTLTDVFNYLAKR